MPRRPLAMGGAPSSTKQPTATRKLSRMARRPVMSIRPTNATASTHRPVARPPSSVSATQADAVGRTAFGGASNSDDAIAMASVPDQHLCNLTPPGLPLELDEQVNALADVMAHVVAPEP